MKKILIVFFLIMLIATFFKIINMYALYKTEIEDEYQTKLGIWNIDINNENITASDFTEFSNELNVQKVESSTSADGKIAPGEKFYVEINIDPKDTDVSIVYELSCDEIKSSIDEKIKEITQEDVKWNISISEIKSVFCKEGENEIEQSDELENFTDNKYIGIIPLEKINDKYINKLKIIFVWENDEENNEIDSMVGTTVLNENDNLDEEETLEENAYSVNKMTVLMYIKLKQYIGESIYTP